MKPFDEIPMKQKERQRLLDRYCTCVWEGTWKEQNRVRVQEDPNCKLHSKDQLFNLAPEFP